MVVNRKVTGKAMSVPIGLVLGLGISLLITIIAAGVVAWMVLNESISEQALGYAAMVIVPLSVSIGAVAAAAAVKHQWLAMCAGVGGAYFLALIGTTALFFGGQYSGVWMTLIMTVLGVAIACFIGMKGLGKQGRKIKKYRPR